MDNEALCTLIAIGRRLKREREPGQQRRLSIRERFARFVRALFSSGPRGDESLGEPEGGVGVREPRRPLRPSQSGAVALEAPPDEQRDVWAVGDEER